MPKQQPPSQHPSKLPDIDGRKDEEPPVTIAGNALQKATHDTALPLLSCSRSSPIALA
jgi:hypothetical protein